MQQSSSQQPVFFASTLGYLGLLPFVIPTLLLGFDAPHTALWLHFLMTYAAVILSFVGALHIVYTKASYCRLLRSNAGRTQCNQSTH
jgi:hypothetical protein